MDVKDRLRAYLPALREAEQLAKEYDAMREVWIRSPRLDGMPRSSGTSGLDEQVARIDAIMQRFERSREKALRILDDVEDLIEQLSEADERTVLRLKYVRGLTWEMVATEMAWSDSTVRRIHRGAIAELEAMDERL